MKVINGYVKYYAPCVSIDLVDSTYLRLEKKSGRDNGDSGPFPSTDGQAKMKRVGRGWEEKDRTEKKQSALNLLTNLFY